MKCKICNQNNKPIFSAKILGKYDIKYYHCSNCGFLQTEEPYWLEEAYKESINISDTGILSRNLYLSKITSVLIFFFFNKNNKFLDFGGGYGIFVRLMRDIGLDFYWQDKFSQNLLARGFEYEKNKKYELITSFETFEHFVSPINEIETMIRYSDSILFSTDILPTLIPEPTGWWYYGLEHGQHISFYNLKTLQFIAQKYNLNLYTNRATLHLLTKKKINRGLFYIVVKLANRGLSNLVKHRYKSRTWEDHEMFK